MKNFKSLIAFVLLFGTVFATLNVSVGDQGDNVRFISNGTFVNNGNLTILIYDASSGGNLLYNETFAGAILNGSWNVMIGENQPLALDYGFVYWKDYEINGENLNFVNGSGSAVDRQFWYSPLGEIQGSMINESSLNISDGLWELNGSNTIEPKDMNNYVRINEWLTVGVSSDGYIDADGNRNLTVKGGDGYCFSGNTFITTPSGYVRIDALHVGDALTSYDLDTSAWVETTITNITSRTVTTYYTLNNVINATAEHPFYTQDGWKQVQNLTLGDELFDGTHWITLFSKSQTNAPLLVYNLHTTNPYTFFANTFLVHNKDLAPKHGKDLFLLGGYPYLAGNDGDVYLAWDGAISVGKAIVGGALELFSELQMYDDTPIYLDSNWVKYLMWNSGDLAFEFNDNLQVIGNVSADYFIGDGSQLTNLSVTNYWNRSGTTLLPATNGDGVFINGTLNVTGNIYGANVISSNGAEADIIWAKESINIGAYISGTDKLNLYNSSGTRKLYITDTGDIVMEGYLDIKGDIYAYSDVYLVDDKRIIFDVAGSNSVYYDSTSGQFIIATDIGTYFNNSVNITGNLNVSNNINAFNYSVNGSEIISSNRDIADAETANHNIGTYSYSVLNGRNATIGSGLNYLNIDSNGELTLNGTARKTKSVYRAAYDIYGNAGTYNSIVCTAAGAGVLNTKWYVRVFGDGAGTNVCDSAIFTTMLPEDYEPETNITIGVHWSSVAVTGNVVYGVGILAVGDNENYTANPTYVSQTVSVSASQYFKNEVLFNFSGSGFSKDDDLAVIIYRHGDAAGDTLVGDTYIHNAGLYYITNDFGSNKISGS